LAQASIHDALVTLPDGLREPLIAEFLQSLSEYRAADWEKVGLKAGKFCEIAYCICAGHATGSYPSTAQKPQNFLKSCLDLEQFNKCKGRSLCIQVPRILLGMYELRNNRSIGHISGDLSPNHMDADYFIRAMKWVLAEFVRQFSKLEVSESHKLIESVTARTYHMVWSNGDKRRVLEPARTASQKVLILLYAEAMPVLAAQLQIWIDYKNGTQFRQKILRELHQKAYIHFDEKNGYAEILPPGQTYVESSGLLLVEGR
jgi:hypothetical protein